MHSEAMPRVIGVEVFCPELKGGDSGIPNGIFMCHQPVFCSLHGSCSEISVKL